MSSCTITSSHHRSELIIFFTYDLSVMSASCPLGLVALYPFPVDHCNARQAEGNNCYCKRECPRQRGSGQSRLSSNNIPRAVARWPKTGRSGKSKPLLLPDAPSPPDGRVMISTVYIHGDDKTDFSCCFHINEHA